MALKQRNSPWLKRVLIPFWVIQLAFMIYIFVTYCMNVINVEGTLVYEILVLIFSLACIALDITEIALFARHKLQPLTYLVFQLIKSAMCLIMFLYAVITGISGENRTAYTYGNQYANASFGYPIYEAIFAIVFFAFLGTLIYSSVIFHRHRRNKRKLLTNTNNGISNPYYNGPFSESGIATASYQPLEDSNALHGGEPRTVPYDSATAMGPYYESGGEAIEYRPSELGGTQGKNALMKYAANEWLGETGKYEAYELAASRSIRSGKGGR